MTCQMYSNVHRLNKQSFSKDWLANKFASRESIDLRNDPQSLQRLTEAAEKAKIELSSLLFTTHLGEIRAVFFPFKKTTSTLLLG